MAHRILLYSILLSAFLLVSIPGLANDALVQRASVASDGREGNNQSWYPVLDDDGQQLVFLSLSSNLTPNGTGKGWGVFLHDKPTGETQRLDGGAKTYHEEFNSVAISASGRYIVFSSWNSEIAENDANEAADVFLYDQETKTIEHESLNDQGEQANGNSWPCAVSTDGRFVAFSSTASNLVPHDNNLCGGLPASNCTDVFVRDTEKDTTERVSVSAAGAQGDGSSWCNDMTPDGRFVVFSSRASNLSEQSLNGGSPNNNATNVFVRDRQAGTTDIVSVDGSGNASSDESLGGAISADGRFVAFESTSSSLVAGDNNNASDVFVRDLLTRQTQLISVSGEGGEADGESHAPDMTADGRYVAFSSFASNLVPADTNGHADVFVRDVVASRTTVLSANAAGNLGNGDSLIPSIAGNGTFVAFASNASNLVSNDANGKTDIFVRDITNAFVPTSAPSPTASSPIAVVTPQPKAPSVGNGYRSEGDNMKRSICIGLGLAGLALLSLLSARRILSWRD